MPDGLEIFIDGLSYGGEGVGRLPDGKAVFVPFTIPGELVRIRIVEDKKKYARAELLEVLKASPNRIVPRCKHFGDCGGCQLQHMTYACQLEQKREMVLDQLRHSGLAGRVEVAPVIASPMEWNYRNTVQFHQTMDGRLGYQRARSHDVIPIEECFLPLPSVEQAWKDLALDPTCLMERVSIRSGEDEDVLVSLETGSLDVPELELDLPYSVVHLGPAGSLVLAGNPFIPIQVSDQLFQVSAGAFFQVNTPVAGKMVQHVLDLLPPGKLGTLVDLYCGVGLFSRFLATRVDNLIGIELSESACEDFTVNLADFNDVALYQGSAEQVFPYLEMQPRVVIVDPPRAGLGNAVTEALVKLSPEYIVYVSCDPSTFARDVARLAAGGYTPGRVQPFDLFPQTYHVECVTMMTKGVL